MKSLIAISFFLLSFGLTGDITTELQQQATTENKNIAVYFCGSDWCANCNRFKREVLSVPEVDSLLDNAFVYYTADFPQATKQEKHVVSANEFLAEKLNPAGEFPVLVIASPDWKVKAKIYRGGTAGEIAAKLKQNSK